MQNLTKPPEVSSASTLASVTSSVLHVGRVLHQVSLTLSCLVIAQILVCRAFNRPVPSPWSLCVVLCLGLAELWFALRVALDAKLFAQLAARSHDLNSFDCSMQALKLRPKGAITRTVEDRAQGAMRLLKLQGLMLLLQIAGVAMHLLSW